MNKPLPTMQELAAEAEFQLMTATDQLNWLTALVCAIHLDHTHGRGKYAAHLAQVAAFLSDTGFSGVHSAISEFKELSESAPQNAQVAIRGAAGDGKTLGQRILAAREQAGLTQPELAKLVGIEQASISQLELGRTKRTSYLAEIARACSVGTDWLAFGSEGGQ
ncbi:helix-turn-helix domain-containing protein [Pseudomonas bohemica]|uniref:helix-turn-helix domain-containing protein n=1 Tax=Pseudomonas bohemica TaxID=2044872 RepID=UPI001F2E1CB0|nr:helix-turn-helix transcriptional regulator [Pseudomonas bohemica]